MNLQVSNFLDLNQFWLKKFEYYLNIQLHLAKNPNIIWNTTIID